MGRMILMLTRMMRYGAGAPRGLRKTRGFHDGKAAGHVICKIKPASSNESHAIQRQAAKVLEAEN